MMNGNIRISVVVAVYNTEQYLGKCIDSIINQTYKDLEIILVDDGSTDSCGDICDSYSEKDSRVKVIHKKNGGVVSAKKMGAKYATGDYVCSVDSDDWIDPDRFYHFVKQGAITDADMVYMEGYYKDYDNRSVLIESAIDERLYQGKEIIEEVFPMIIDTKCCFKRDIRAMQVCWGIKRELFCKAIDEIDDRVSMGDDYVHILFCMLEAESIFLMKEHGYHYVERMQSISHSLGKNSLRGVKIWTQAVRDKIKYFNYGEDLYSQIVFLEMWYIMNCDYSILLDEKDGFLYPYSKVQRGSRIAVYGAGAVGTQLVKALDHTPNYQVTLWVDKYSSGQPLEGHIVENPSKLLETPFDYVVIAVLDIAIVREIEKYLLECGVPEQKIATMDASVIVEKSYE